MRVLFERALLITSYLDLIVIVNKVIYSILACLVFSEFICCQFISSIYVPNEVDSSGVVGILSR